jgi:L-fuconolactonase
MHRDRSCANIQCADIIRQGAVLTIVDAHQHFWSLNEPWFDWPTPDLAPIYRDYAPADLWPRINAAGVSKTVLVQVAPCLAETESILKLARSTVFVAGVVGWIDLEKPDHLPTLEGFADDPKFCGVRPMIQSIPDVNWMLRPSLRPSLSMVERLGLTFDALVKPPHLEALAQFVDLYPNLPVVINHGAKPEIAKGREGFDFWANRIAALAERPHMFCKLSGLLTEAGERTHPEHLVPFVDHLIDVFGPQRLMWGSDWPVVELAAPYSVWFDQVSGFISRLSESEQKLILGEVARTFYRLKT